MHRIVNDYIINKMIVKLQKIKIKHLCLANSQIQKLVLYDYKKHKKILNK